MISFISFCCSFFLFQAPVYFPVSLQLVKQIQVIESTNMPTTYTSYPQRNKRGDMVCNVSTNCAYMYIPTYI